MFKYKSSWNLKNIRSNNAPGKKLQQGLTIKPDPQSKKRRFYRENYIFFKKIYDL
jgi:hypothetical protein